MKKSSFAVAALLAATLTAPTFAEAASASRDPRILGGTDTEAGELPALTYVDIDGKYLCTGVLVDPEWVLTAAHCADAAFYGIAPRDFQEVVQFDRLQVSDTSVLSLRVDQIVVHPSWNPENYLEGNDIALLHLVAPVTDREPMPWNRDPALAVPGQSVTFIGYGVYVEGDVFTGGGAHTLAARTTVPCAMLGGDMPVGDDRLLCFDQHDGRGLCHGDSGGPVLASIGGVTTVIGVNSFVYDEPEPTCHGFAASTRTDAFATFIDETIAAGVDESGGGCGCVVGARSGRGGAATGAAVLALAALVLVRRRRVVG